MRMTLIVGYSMLIGFGIAAIMAKLGMFAPFGGG